MILLLYANSEADELFCITNAKGINIIFRTIVIIHGSFNECNNYLTFENYQNGQRFHVTLHINNSKYRSIHLINATFLTSNCIIVAFAQIISLHLFSHLVAGFAWIHIRISVQGRLTLCNDSVTCIGKQMGPRISFSHSRHTHAAT